jgi:hypothetical protein
LSNYPRRRRRKARWSSLRPPIGQPVVGIALECERHGTGESDRRHRHRGGRLSQSCDCCHQPTSLALHIVHQEERSGRVAGRNGWLQAAGKRLFVAPPSHGIP